MEQKVTTALHHTSTACGFLKLSPAPEVPAICRFVEAFPDMEEFHASDNFFGDDGVEAILRVRTGLLASQGRGVRGWVTQLYLFLSGGTLTKKLE